MKLAIETSKRRASLAIEKNGELHLIEMNSDERQSSHLLSLVKRNLEKHEIKPSEIESFLLNIGPGSSTGLRMGIAMAQGWAAVFPKVKFVGTHLESMALEVLKFWNPNQDRAYLIADAFAGQLFIQDFKKESGEFVFDGELRLVDKSAVNELEKSAAIIDDLGPLKNKIEWPEAYEWSSLDFPHAKWVMRSEIHHNEPQKIEKMDVRYLKATSAELSWNKRMKHEHK